MIAADHFIVWRAFTRQSKVDATHARHMLWLRGGLMWAASTLVMWSWTATGVPMASVGFSLPEGWRLWVPLAATIAFASLQTSSAIKVARLPAPSEKLRAQLGSVAAICPRAVSELPAFFGVSLTAGFC